MENELPQKQETFSRRLVFVLAVLFMDFFFVLLLNLDNGLFSLPAAIMLIMGAFTGFMMGQIAFALIWSGFLCQTWTRSFFGALGLALVACYLLLLAIVIGSSFRPDASILYYPLIVPVFAVTGNVPLWIARYLRGWRFESSAQSMSTAPPMGIEDILHLTAIVAASIMLSRAIASFSEGAEVFGRQSQWFMILVIAALFGLSSTPITLLSARFCTSSRTEDRIAKTFFLAVITFGLIAFAGLALSGGSIPWEFIAYLGLCCVFAYGTLWAGLTSFVADGLRFAVRGKAIEVQGPTEALETKQESPFENSPFVDAPTTVTEGNVSRTLDRTLVTGFVLIAVLFGIRGAVNQRQETSIQKAEAATHQTLRDNAGAVDVDSGMVFRYVGTEKTDDSLVSNLSALTSLQELNLSNSRVTNRGIAALASLPSLEVLNISGTQVTDAVFDSLNRHEFKFKVLDVSNTPLKAEGIKKITDKVRCEKLCLRGLSLVDDDIKSLSTIQCEEWDLRDNPISTIPSQAKAVILGNNSIDPSALPDLVANLESLEIDGLPIEDQDLAAIVQKNPKLRRLALANTKLTSQSVGSLAMFGNLHELTLGPNCISGEIDWSSLPPVERLRVHTPHPGLVIDFLAEVSSATQLLDLSGSNVTDDVIQRIPNMKFLSVNLDNTRVSLKAVQYLYDKGCREVSVRGTRVRSEDLVNWISGLRMRRVPMSLVVDSTQVSESEKNQIEQQSLIRFQRVLSVDRY